MRIIAPWCTTYLILTLFLIHYLSSFIVAMPELPEVEAARKFVEQYCAGSSIVRLETKEQGGGPRDGLFDDIIIENDRDDTDLASGKGSRKKYNAAELELRKVMLDNQLLTVNRKGKHIWFGFKNNPDRSVLFHFGMTGSFVIRDHTIPTYKSFKIYTKENWPPKFTKMEMEFSNGVHLAFCDPRRIGRIKIRTKPLESPPLSDLAPDPVRDPLPSPEEFFNKLQGYSCPIKALLLDQEKVFCGIGNYLADEILYQAAVHPESRCNTINTAGCARLLQAMSSILKIAIDANAEYADFPIDWLFHYRWEKGKKEKMRMPDGNEIVYETHGGRTSAIVPAVQSKRGYYLIGSNATFTAVEAVEGKGKKKRIMTAMVETKDESVVFDGNAVVTASKRGAKSMKVETTAPIDFESVKKEGRGNKKAISAVPPPPLVSTSVVASTLRRVTRSLKK